MRNHLRNPNKDPRFLNQRPILGGSWVVIRWGYKSHNIGYNYSDPTYNPTQNYSLNPKSPTEPVKDTLKGTPLPYMVITNHEPPSTPNPP